MILSVPDGYDKPLKYSLMFQVCDVVLVNKIDSAAGILTLTWTNAASMWPLRNPDARVIPIRARTGEGTDEWGRLAKRAGQGVATLKASPAGEAVTEGD
jgi:Ni2+-binding GTPase involved in regulation of expression and maturation of urease and hydrogenase